MARTQVIAVVGGLALAAGGAGYFLFGVYLPGKARQVVQAGVEDWQARWDAARGCLLGPTPASSRTSEAVTLRELSPDPWDRGSCTAVIGKLARGEVADSGVPAVEQAWDEIDHAASAVAKAFGDHVANLVGGSDPLPAALDALEVAGASLRKAAGLPAIAAKGGAPLPTAVVLPLALGDDPVITLEAPLRPSSGTLIAFGATKRKVGVEVVLRAGQAPQVFAVHAGVVRSGAAPGWGAFASGTGVDVGAVDPSGAVQASSTLPLPGAVLLGVIGQEADGTIAYGVGEDLRLARGAVITTEPGVGALTSAFEPGAAALLWRKHDLSWQALTVTTGAPIGAPVGFTVDDVDAPRLCLAGHTAWLSFGVGAMLAITDGVARQVTVADGERPYHSLEGCTPTAAIVTLTGMTYASCGATCERATAPAAFLPSGASNDTVATSQGGKPLALAARGHVVATWDLARGARFFATGVDLRPTVALSDDHTVDLLAHQGEQYVVVRVP
jgi:hypothetical protein